MDEHDQLAWDKGAMFSKCDNYALVYALDTASYMLWRSYEFHPSTAKVWPCWYRFTMCRDGTMLYDIIPRWCMLR